MKNRERRQGFFAGILAAMLVTTLVVPVGAALVAKTIQVSTGVNLYLDDNKFVPKDASGNQVEVFVYNGTTYLPARAISEAIGKPIQWDGATQSVYIGSHSSETPAAMLSDLKPFTGSTFSAREIAIDNLSIERSQCHEISVALSRRVYKINAQYSALHGTLFQSYERRNSTQTATFEVYGDGRLLYSATMTGGKEPIDFNIDITGVLELKIVTDSTYFNVNRFAYLSNVALYT